MSSASIVLDVVSLVVLQGVVGVLELDRATIQSLPILQPSPPRARLEDCSAYCSCSVEGTGVENDIIAATRNSLSSVTAHTWLSYF